MKRYGQLFRGTRSANQTNGIDYSKLREGDLRAIASMSPESPAGRAMKAAAEAELKKRQEFKRSFVGRSIKRV